MFSAVIYAAALLFASIAAAQNTGYATYSNNNGGVCSKVSSGLPVVSMNAAQFGGGDACGQCVQIQGTGNGAGTNPVSTAPYIAVINNVCPQCAPGDIDLQESGDGKFGITWSFVACPGSGRRLSEGGRKMAVEEVAIPQVSHPTEAVTPALQTAEESLTADEQPESISSLTDATLMEQSSEEQSSHESLASGTEETRSFEKIVSQEGKEASESQEAASPMSVESLIASRRMLL